MRAFALVLLCPAYCSFGKRLHVHSSIGTEKDREGAYSAPSQSVIDIKAHPCKPLSVLLLAMSMPATAFHASYARLHSRVAHAALSPASSTLRNVIARIFMQDTKDIHQQIFETKAEYFGDDDEATLAAKLRYAEALFGRGKKGEAQKPLRELVEATQQILDLELDVIEIKRLLAETMIPDGDLGEAERLLQEALKARKDVANFDDVSVAVQILQSAEALPFKGASKPSCRDLIDEEHLDEFMDNFNHAEDRNRLKEPCYYQGPGEKIRIDQQTFEGYKANLLHNIQSALRIVFALAEIAVAKGDLDQAKFLHAKVFTDRCKVFGNLDSETLNSAKTLAKVLDRMGLPEQAEQLALRFSELTEKAKAKSEGEKLSAAMSGAKKDVNVASHLQLDVDENGEPTTSTFVYVDERLCVGCTFCCTEAKNTFFIEESAGKARAYAQGHDPEKLEEAIDCCPANCISYVDQEDLIILETEREKAGPIPRGRRSQFWYNPRWMTSGSHVRMWKREEEEDYMKKLAETDAKKKAKAELQRAEELKKVANSMPLIFDSATVADRKSVV